MLLKIFWRLLMVLVGIYAIAGAIIIFNASDMRQDFLLGLEDKTRQALVEEMARDYSVISANQRSRLASNISRCLVSKFSTRFSESDYIVLVMSFFTYAPSLHNKEWLVYTEQESSICLLEGGVNTLFN